VDWFRGFERGSVTAEEGGEAMIRLNPPFSRCVPILPIHCVTLPLVHSKTWQKGEKNLLIPAKPGMTLSLEVL
jgi:hypothetical protein